MNVYRLDRDPACLPVVAPLPRRIRLGDPLQRYPWTMPRGRGCLVRAFRTAGWIIFVSIVASLRVGNSAPAAEPRRPNIVFIFSDDHAYQAISAYGDPRSSSRRPNIDRIGREGMRFDRCLVPNSICGPSRATVLTGKYSHLNGFYNNTNSRFDGSQPTFPKLLKAAGYQTAIIGKWHLVSDPTGFDEWHILPGQGVYYNPPMIHNGKRVKHEGYTTDLITDFSLDWLKNRDKSKPFLLMCQHKAPHREWEPPLRHLGHDGDRVYPEPATLFDDYAGRGKAEHDQDMTIAKTMNAARPQAHPAATASPPISARPGTPITSPATPPSARPTPRAKTSSAGSISATCTTISAASRRSTTASAGS